jgi:hypothetical protein
MVHGARRPKITKKDKAMNHFTTIHIGLSDHELARLDELKPDGTSRSAFIRQLVRDADPVEEVPTYEQVIALLWDLARAGKTAAAIALERALRPKGETSSGDDDEFWRIVRGDD